MKKKVLSVLLSVAMISTLLVGCGSGSSNSAPADSASGNDAAVGDDAAASNDAMVSIYLGTPVEEGLQTVEDFYVNNVWK